MIAGLKPYPAMKDSGVPWLGEVPEHWTISRLKSSMENIIQQTGERRATDLYLALEHVESWTGRIRHAASDVSFDSQVKRFRSGDVLFGKLRPYLAKVTRPIADGVCVGEFLVLRPRDPAASPSYMEQLLRSKPIIDAVNSSTFGAKMPRADWQFMGGMVLTLPPVPEQLTIVRFLDEEITRLSGGTERAHHEISLLREYRTRLIADVVTGKLDVREAAARLPDEAEDLEPLDESEVANDAEEAADDLDAAAEETEA
jgi:type I restriction enzyme S subunit